MKRPLLMFVVLILLASSLSACLPTGLTVQEQVSEAYIQTAVSMTLTAERGLEAGAVLSTTSTPGEDTSLTPSAEETSTPEETGEPEDPQATAANPWVLQSWCIDHPGGCMEYKVHNKTESWLQIEIREKDTGVTGFFSVRTKTLSKITLIPGVYQVKYTYWCGGEAVGYSETKGFGPDPEVFECP